MNMRECVGIIAHPLGTQWKALKDKWRGSLLERSVYPKLRRFSKEVAEEAAYNLVADGGYAPSPEKWRAACRAIQPEAEDPARVPCKACGRTGWLSVSAEMRGGALDVETVADSLAENGPERRSFAVPCICENAPQVACPQRLQKAAFRAVSAFTRAQGGSDRLASPEAWRAFMGRARGLLKPVPPSPGDGFEAKRRIARQAAMLAEQEAKNEEEEFPF